MTDLMSGAETLEDIRMIVFCGGFPIATCLARPRAGLRASVGTRRLGRRLKPSMQGATLCLWAYAMVAN